MAIHHVNKPDSFFMNLIRIAFPNYRGRKFKLSTDIPPRLDSYWSGGSKDKYVFVELKTKREEVKFLPVANNHPFFKAGMPRKLDKLPVGLVLVKHSIFQGKDMGITIYGNTENITPLLPPVEILSVDEDAVLFFTRSLKSSYAGVKNYRFINAHREMGITEAQWDEAKTNLIQRKLLNKAGAITAAGKNAVGNRHSYKKY